MIDLKDEGSRRTRDRTFIVELLYVKIGSKSIAFGIRGSSGEVRGYFLSLSYG